ncbi:MAG: helix-turn-helix transcriptional regulator [Bacteroidaceae bacterium]|nr:helix-turn-helix transcriptional regulator [Bacteroidaceae bacterium]
MYDQIRVDILFIIFYAGVTFMAMMASCYLLFRDGNAFAADITPPVRLRRWGAAFLASIAMSHAWYMPIFFLTSSEDIRLCDLVGGLLDCMTFFPLAIIVLLTMLQDRKRPLWPVAAMMAPIVAAGVYGVVARSYALLPAMYLYFLLMCIGIIIYMVRATRQYGRWLRDNYADLEHKEVWQSFVVLAVILLVFALYMFTSKGTVYQYAMQVIHVILIGYLLWRVETLSDLSIPVNDAAEEMGTTEHEEDNVLSLSIRNRSASPLGLSKNIGPLLKKYCEEPQLYLQYDISVTQLAQQIGINRSYLSKHFALQGISYNAYINGLRIQHFVNLYHESVAKHHLVTAQQLAHQSGFRSYSTFSAAFKQSMGMTATEWMRVSES